MYNINTHLSLKIISKEHGRKEEESHDGGGEETQPAEGHLRVEGQVQLCRVHCFVGVTNVAEM